LSERPTSIQDVLSKPVCKCRCLLMQHLSSSFTPCITRACPFTLCIICSCQHVMSKSFRQSCCLVPACCWQEINMKSCFVIHMLSNVYLCRSTRSARHKEAGSVPSWLLRSCPQVALLDGETLQRFSQTLALQVVLKVCSPFAINNVA